MTVDEQLALLRRATTEIISEVDLRKKLESGRKLRVKLGVDPTARDVTLGWAVVLRKLRDFQRCGHQAVLVVGDFTAQIGDPSGKSKTRKQLTKEEVQVNVDAVLTQFGKILDIGTLEIRHNSEWLGAMSFADVIRMTARTTVARIMERDDFTKRWEAHQPISMHELMYPLCQATDSVALKADVELGGNDQKFNNLMGRQLQEAEGQEPQTVVLSPLLVGTDGTEKMSQSLGNYVSINEAPNDMFGKTMSIPDGLIRNWFELCTDVPMTEVDAMLGEGKNPRDAKMRLGREIVALYHGDAAADAAVAYFVETFSKRQQPAEAPERTIPTELGDEFPLASLIGTLGMAKSNSAARDLIKQGGVSLDGNKLTDPMIKVARCDVAGKTLRVGKHQFAPTRVAAPAWKAGLLWQMPSGRRHHEPLPQSRRPIAAMRWFSMVRTVQRYWKMAHDPRTPAAVRYLIYGGIAFTLVPDDWLPDWIPGLGLIDDAAVIPGVIAASMLLIPQEVKDDADRETEKGVADKKKAGPSYQLPAKTAGLA